MPAAWDVAAAGVGEAPVGEWLVGPLDAGGYLVADGNDDSSPLFDASARSGYQSVVDHWRPDAGAGHRRVSPHRPRSIALRPTAFGRALDAVRGGIERCSGNAVGFAGGLGPLPAWVRRGHRVDRLLESLEGPIAGNVALLTDLNPNGATWFVRVAPSVNRGGRAAPVGGYSLDIGLGGGWWYREDD